MGEEIKRKLKAGDDVYIARNIVYDSKIFTIYNIDEEGIYSIVEKDSEWDYKEGVFKLPGGEIVSMTHLRRDDLMTVDDGLEFLIDRFSFLINRHVMKTTNATLVRKPVKDVIIERIRKKLYDNR
jgi:hypothetical protein